MSNRRELERARAKEAAAIASRVGVEGLPRRIGSSVTWGNGVVWIRVGDDSWSPNGVEGPEWLYPSDHVAGGNIIDRAGV